METIKCKKCGAIMGAGSEVCPVCGTVVDKLESKPFAEEQTSKTPSHEQAEGASLLNLETELKDNLSIQRSNPQQMVETHINIFDENMKVKEGYEDAHELGAGYTITNCVFSPKDGKPVFDGTLNDGKSHLMMQFLFPKFGEEYNNFKQLDCYSLFTGEEVSGLLYYSLDCGEDANKAAEIFTKVLVGTFGVSNDFYDSFFTDKKGMSKDTAAKEARNNSVLYGKSHKPSFFRNLKACIGNAF